MGRCVIPVLRISASALLIALTLPACSQAGEATPTPTEPPPVTSLTTLATTMTSSTTTSAPQVTSTTLGPPDIHVSGGTVVYTTSGDLFVEGWISVPAVVTIGGTPTETRREPDGRTVFFAELTDMDTGSYDIPIEATTRDGRVSTLDLTIVHDPTSEEQFAYIVSASIEPPGVVADYAQWFSGEAADAAAAEDGAANDDGTVDGGFYIRNVNDRLRTLPVAPGAAVVLYACHFDGPCLTRESVDLETLRSLLDEPGSDVATVGWQWYGGGTLPYWLFIENGVVVHIEEHYLP